MQPRSFRWIGTLYAPVWLVPLALYTLAFTAGGVVSFYQALAIALYYTLPPAVFGVGVIQACMAMPWSSERRAQFFAKHVGLDVMFAGLCAATTVAFFRLHPIFPEELAAAEGGERGIFVGMFFLGSLVYCLLVGFTYAAIGENRRQEQAAAAARAEALRAQAELKALRAQVNPHFLFNTLHSLIALVRKDARAAEEALEQFGDLMRYALRVQQEVGDEVALAEEWAFARDYLALEKLRLGERLRVHTDIDDAALAHSVPAFSLQSLLENSIGHAVAPRAAGGDVWIRAAASGGRLTLEVRDDGPGAAEEDIEASDGTGLRLLRRRLAALHGDAATLTTRSDDDGFSVIVELPARVTSSTEEGPVT